jgi:hypothetical protein
MTNRVTDNRYGRYDCAEHLPLLNGALDRFHSLSDLKGNNHDSPHTVQ